MSGLTMQEVIEHCEKTAKRIEDNVEFCREWLEAEPISLHSKRYMEHKQTAEWLKELQRYKDLEEAGRLITLPCWIGDKVYDISDVLNGDESDISVINVKWITLEEDENGKLYFDISGFDYYPEDFGNIAFLTEEEAYAELSRIFQAMQDELEAEAEWVAMEGGAE